MVSGDADIAVVGASAAGLMAGIAAGRAAGGNGLRIVAVDGAKKLGTKILIAGGGRCNVTHDEVSEDDYAGGSRNAIRSVLRRFGVERTVAFFAELGVELKREETGKLFPVTDDARTVLEALLHAAREAGVELAHPARVERVARAGSGFEIAGEWGSLSCTRLILATGGRALPKSGSDGAGYELAQGLGHTITRRVVPALAPLVLAEGAWLRELSGVSAPARLELRASTGRRLAAVTGPTLCTHFGLSGPAPMDISRHWTLARMDDPGVRLVACWLPEVDAAAVDADLVELGRWTVARWLRGRLPDRLAELVCAAAGVDPGLTGAGLTRAARKSLVEQLMEMPLEVTGDRGFAYAEATAGGVPLEEITVSSMSSRRCEGLHLCGELCDVDGRIGGFNFQWAWASGWVAGEAAAREVLAGRAGG